MADKSFGVKDINLIGASGTPTIESPNNLNINATNVAISTDITVGGMVSLGAGTSISSPGTNVLTFGTNSTEKVRITSDGKIGIGVASPDGLLEVYNSSTAGNTVLKVHNDKTGDAANLTLEGKRTSINDSGQLLFKNNGYSVAGILAYSGDGNNNDNGELSFRTSASSSGSVITERLRITSGGDVVIGNSSAADNAHFQHYTSATRHQSFQSTNGDLAIVTDNNSNPAVYIKGTGTADLLRVFDNTTQVFTIKDGGDVELGNNCNLVVASGNGIDFSANSNASGMASELLDDYEEGTFTPTVTVEGQSAATTDKQYGRYIKVGNKVTVWCYVQLNGTPSGRGVNNAWQHGGLPFSQRNTAGGFDIAGSILYWTIDSTSALNGTPPYHLVPRLFNNATGGRIRAHDSSSSQSGQNASLLLKDNTEYTYTFTYEVA